MKKAVLISLAAVMLAAPMAQAQGYRYDNRRPVVEQTYKKPPYRKTTGKHWNKGERMNDWRRHAEVRDYRRHGLRQPAQGQRWVQVDDRYLLISVATGLIAGIMAAR